MTLLRVGFQPMQFGSVAWWSTTWASIVKTTFVVLSSLGFEPWRAKWTATTSPAESTALSIYSLQAKKLYGQNQKVMLDSWKTFAIH